MLSSTNVRLNNRIFTVATQANGERVVTADVRQKPGDTTDIKKFNAYDMSFQDKADMSKNKAGEPLTGKWMLFVKQENVNTAWDIVTKGIVTGTFGSACFYLIKSATPEKQLTIRSQNLDLYPEASTDHSMIAIRTLNRHDTVERFQVLLELSKSGLLALSEDKNIKYKSDQATKEDKYDGISSCDTTALADFKMQTISQLKPYLSWVGYFKSFFGFRHHYSRALFVEKMITNARSLEEIKSILDQQIDLFENGINEAHFLKSLNKNEIYTLGIKNKNPEKSWFFQILQNIKKTIFPSV